jgi:probable phosphoglycerate mutase
MRLILSRHGNTFSPGEKAAWVGRRSDLPLVEEGRRQAVRLGEELQGADVAPAAIYCGPLLRTTHYAELVAERLGNFIAPIADEALTEIDYGDWEGLTSHEIVERFGGNVLEAWESRSIWPTSAGWLPPEAELARRIEAFVCGLAQAYTKSDTVLAVTSNGILRYFLRLDRDAFGAQARARAIKVATGNICIMAAQEGSHRVTTWNATPEAKLLRSALYSGAEGM